MIVRLLNCEAVNDAVFTMYDACRICKGLPLKEHKEYKLEKAQKVVKEALESGHTSIAEHVTFRFYIEGISRACSHQLVRYRHCSFSQESLRSVDIGKAFDDHALQAYTGMIDTRYDDSSYTVEKTLNTVFVIPKAGVDIVDLAEIVRNYKDEVENGCALEDARGMLPMCTATKLLMTVNLRELIHICNERLCNRAQAEIKNLATAMKQAISDEFISSLLVPKCESLGYCPEKECCGRCKRKEDVLNG